MHLYLSNIKTNVIEKVNLDHKLSVVFFFEKSHLLVYKFFTHQTFNQ